MAIWEKLLKSNILGNSALEKIAAIAEDNKQSLAKISTSVTDIASSNKKVEELLVVQNKILTEIRDGKGKKGGAKADGSAMSIFKDIAAVGAGAAVAIVGITAALAIAAGILSFAPNIANILGSLVTIAAVAGVLFLITPGFVKMLNAFSSMKASKSITASEGDASISASQDNLDIMGMVGSIGASALSMLAMVGTLAVSSWLLHLVVAVPIPKLITALAIAGVIAIAAMPFVQAIDIFSKMRQSKGADVAGMGGASQEGTDIMGILASTGAAIIGIISMGVALTMMSWVFQLIAPVSPVQLLTAFAISIIMVPISIAAGSIIKALAPIASNPLALGLAIAGAALAMPLLAAGIAGAAHVWNLLMPDEFLRLPDWDWILRFGAILILGAGTFYLASLAVKGLSLKEVIFASMAIPLIMGGFALAIKAWELLGPDDVDSMSPLPDYAVIFKMAVLITLLAIPVFILGKIPLQGLIIGALAIPLVIGALALALQVWSRVAPDNSVAIADMIAGVFMAPVNAMIDALVRIKEEIGIDNLPSLALGLLEVSGALLVFGAALAGVGVGGAVAAIGGAVGAVADAFSSWVSGKEVDNSPVGTLLRLADNHVNISKLGKALPPVADSFAKIAFVGAPAVTRASSFFKALNDYNYDKQAIALPKIASAYKMIADSSNVMNVKAIEATDNMFKSLKDLAESGGDNTIEQLGEMLVDVIEALTDAVETMNSNNEPSMLDKAKQLVSGTSSPSTAATATTPNTGNTDLLTAISMLTRRLDGILYVEVAGGSQLR